MAERQYRRTPTRPDVQECNVSSVSAGCNGVADGIQLDISTALSELAPTYDCTSKVTASPCRAGNNTDNSEKGTVKETVKALWNLTVMMLWRLDVPATVGWRTVSARPMMKPIQTLPIPLVLPAPRPETTGLHHNSTGKVSSHPTAPQNFEQRGGLNNMDLRLIVAWRDRGGPMPWATILV
jgi:hypothetical protein